MTNTFPVAILMFCFSVTGCASHQPPAFVGAWVTSSGSEVVFAGDHTFVVSDLVIATLDPDSATVTSEKMTELKGEWGLDADGVLMVVYRRPGNSTTAERWAVVVTTPSYLVISMFGKTEVLSRRHGQPRQLVGESP